jgi:hypothetical protein
VWGRCELQLLSSGSGEQVALSYSGLPEGRPLPTILEIVAGPVDRCACIRDLSQYPCDCEYLFPPMSFLSPDGPPRSSSSADGFVRVIPVRVNVNPSARTVEELLGQKKRTHCAAFRFLLVELKQELTACLAWSGGAGARFASNPEKDKGGVKATVEGLLEGIVRQCEAVLAAHEERDEREYANNEVFKGLVAEMIETRRGAVSKLRLWLEDPTEHIRFCMGLPLRDAHRRYAAYLVRTVHAAGTEEKRRAAAFEACKARGLLRERIDEVNDVGETPLVAAAADGTSAEDILLLLAAGSAVNGAEGEPSAAVAAAATYGHVHALGALLEARAVVNASTKVVREQSQWCCRDSLLGSVLRQLLPWPLLRPCLLAFSAFDWDLCREFVLPCIMLPVTGTMLRCGSCWRQRPR